MTNQLPPLPDDDSHIAETAPNQSRRQQHPRHPAKPVQQHQRHPQTAHNVERVRRQRRRQSQKDSVLYFPLWSLGLMLLIVLVLAFAVIFLIASLGGRNTISQADPEVRIVTLAPTFTPNIPDPNDVILVTPTLPNGIEVILPAQTPVNQVLDGPLLPTVAFTNTPRPIALGERVVVSNVGDQELNVRNIAGVTSSQVLFRSPEGTEFTIVDGPQQADGFTWWQIQDTTTGQTGWAVANYLTIFDAGAGQ